MMQWIFTNKTFFKTYLIIWTIITEFNFIVNDREESLRDVVTNELDCNVGVSKFEPLPRLFIHFQTNAYGKGVNPLIPTKLSNKYNYSSTRIALVLNNPRRLVCH